MFSLVVFLNIRECCKLYLQPHVYQICFNLRESVNHFGYNSHPEWISVQIIRHFSHHHYYYYCFYIVRLICLVF